MKNLLIPTDFSQNSWNAIKYALSFFKNEDCSFHLLHVVSKATLISGEALAYPAIDLMEKVDLKIPKQKLNTTIKKIKEIGKNEKHRFFPLVEYDYFIDAVRKNVLEKQIDYIIMGTKGASGIKKILIGSNAADVITQVKCATLVIPEKATYSSPKEITFPTDFSMFYSMESLKPLLEIAETHSASIRVLHVFNNKKEKLTNEQITIKEYLSDCFNDTHLSFNYVISNHLDKAIATFVKIKKTQMIVMVAKNLNFFQQILFNPTVEEVTYHTKIPFLVLHE